MQHFEALGFGGRGRHWGIGRQIMATLHHSKASELEGLVVVVALGASCGRQHNPFGPLRLDGLSAIRGLGRLDSIATLWGPSALEGLFRGWLAA